MAGNSTIKKIFAVLTSMALFLPLYAQEAAEDASGQAQGEYYHPYYHPNYRSYYQQDDKPNPQTSDKPVSQTNDEPDLQTGDKPDDIAAAEDEPAGELPPDEPKKTGSGRRHFEIGIDAGLGLDKDLIKQLNTFRKDRAFDLKKIGDTIGPDGLNVNLDVLAGLFVHIKNITIKKGTWDLKFSMNVDGGISFNAPKSLFTLLTEKNINRHSAKGEVTASGSIFADAGLGVSAKYGKLSLGVRPALFAPLVYIPKSKISYDVKNTGSYILLETSGDIQIYSVVNKDGKRIRPGFGSDLSLEGEYALFSFLDVGGSIFNIPLVPAAIENRMTISLDDAFGSVLQGPAEFPEDLDFGITYDSAPIKVFRPLRFDAYARWKPFGEFLAVQPNAGFSVNLNEKQWYFNAGAEARINLLKNKFSFHLGTGIKELFWRHRLGFAMNFKAFELDLEAMLRSQNFAKSFGAQGLGFNLGLRFGF